MGDALAESAREGKGRSPRLSRPACRAPQALLGRRAAAARKGLPSEALASTLSVAVKGPMRVAMPQKEGSRQP